MADYTTKNEQIARLLQDASAAQKRGDQAAAKATLDRVLSLDAVNPAALNSLGMMALDRRDPAAAQAYFEAAAAADPDAAPLWLNVANACRQRGDAYGEEQALLRTLSIDQRDLMATIRLAELHERTGAAAKASGRWGAVLAIVQLMPAPPSGLSPIIAHAQRFVLDHNAGFGAMIDEGLAADRRSLDAPDRRRFDACIDAMLGRRAIFANECAGMKYPFLPADEFFDRRLTPWLDRIEGHTPAIRDELTSLLQGAGEGFEPYVAMDAGTPENKWSGLDHSLDWSAFYLTRYGEPIVAAQKRCPATTRALAEMPCNDLPRRGPTAFFSVLKPRTRLPAHSGVSNIRAIVHLPLIVPEGCGFRVGGETRQWVEGRAFAFDDTIEHEAWNDSDQLRAVLIFDIWNPI